MRSSGVCATASSEEDPTRIDLSGSLRIRSGGGGRGATGTTTEDGEVFSVAFDPLDGSSVIDANFAVGSIFAIFSGREFIRQRIADQRAACMATYGPRTTIIVRRKDYHTTTTAASNERVNI